MTVSGFHQPTIQALGDSAWILQWPNTTGPSTTAADAYAFIRRAEQQLVAYPIEGQLELVPGFDSLTIHVDPATAWGRSGSEQILERLSKAVPAMDSQDRLVTIPVCYHPSLACDIEMVAETHRLSIEQVIELHTSAEYRVQMIGFSPGFPYLAGLPGELATPRRHEPRLVIPVGSVAIGGEQTGIYTLPTPGGWNIIGRTPTRLFLPEEDPPSRLRAGDRVCFTSITLEAYQMAGGGQDG